MKKAKADPPLKMPLKTKDLPATQRMLHLLESKLTNEMKAGFKQIDAKFDVKIDQLSASINSGIKEVLAVVHRQAAQVDRMELLIEEQNSRNVVVLEGLTNLFTRQDRVETRMDDVQRTVESIGRSRSK